MEGGFDKVLGEADQKPEEPSRIEHSCSVILARLYIEDDIADRDLLEMMSRECIYN